MPRCTVKRAQQLADAEANQQIHRPAGQHDRLGRQAHLLEAIDHQHRHDGGGERHALAQRNAGPAVQVGQHARDAAQPAGQMHSRQRNVVTSVAAVRRRPRPIRVLVVMCVLKPAMPRHPERRANRSKGCDRSTVRRAGRAGRDCIARQPARAKVSLRRPCGAITTALRLLGALVGYTRAAFRPCVMRLCAGSRAWNFTTFACSWCWSGPRCSAPGRAWPGKSPRRPAWWLSYVVALRFSAQLAPRFGQQAPLESVHRHVRAVLRHVAGDLAGVSHRGRLHQSGPAAGIRPPDGRPVRGGQRGPAVRGDYLLRRHPVGQGPNGRVELEVRLLHRACSWTGPTP